MSLGSVNPLVPTHTHNQRGATTSPGDVVPQPSVGTPTSTRAKQTHNPRSWGATPEKVALLELGCIPHRRTNDFETIFKAYAPVAEVGLTRGKRKALIVAASYKGIDASGWPFLLGSAVDLKYWGRFLRARHYECDFLWDDLDPLSRPTRDVILLHLQSLARHARSGDEIVLVFSGHGDKSAYIPLNCPLKHSVEAIYPEDFRRSFLDSLPSGVAVLVLWDACHAPNPFELPQRLDLEDGRVVFKSTKDPQVNSKYPAVVVISASSGKTREVELCKEPEKVHCGLLCWAAFTFVFYHLQDSVQPGGVLQALVEHIRFCSEDQPEVIPQFLCSTPDIPPQMLQLLASLFAAYHKRVAH
ncbi:Ca(2+)-dependent cysteine protease [Tulasnella sp. 417]|nr:Ca(2+)-dependent cysteine protease [Tulasnella sp. 417]